MASPESLPVLARRLAYESLQYQHSADDISPAFDVDVVRPEGADGTWVPFFFWVRDDEVRDCYPHTPTEG